VDQSEKNRLRREDIDLLDRLLSSRRLTLTEKREFQALRDDVSSDIVGHYVLKPEERERALTLFRDPDGIPQSKNLTEELLEAVYSVRRCQDLGHHGYHVHLETPRSSMGEWALYLVSILGGRHSGPGPAIAGFRQRMIDLSAAALAAAEWADEQWEEWRRKNPPRD
jgi:hypothetical protein